MQWEVEALEPAELQRLVLVAVAPYVYRDALAEQMGREEQQCSPGRFPRRLGHGGRGIGLALYGDLGGLDEVQRDGLGSGGDFVGQCVAEPRRVAASVAPTVARAPSPPWGLQVITTVRVRSGV